MDIAKSVTEDELLQRKKTAVNPVAMVSNGWRKFSLKNISVIVVCVRARCLKGL